MWCSAVRRYCTPGSVGQRQLGTDWETVGQLPFSANGERYPQHCTRSRRDFTGQTTPICPGTAQGGELQGSGDAPCGTGHGSSLFILLIAWWKSRLT